MRRTFFFIVAVCLATSSFASIPRASALDLSSPRFDPLPETRIRVSEDLALFERPAPSELNRALHQAYRNLNTTNASGLAGFLSVDPARGSADMSRPQSWNRYSYALNNPVLYVDPTGEAPNKAGTTDPKAILQEVRQLQAQGLNKRQIFMELSSRHGGNENRYFFTNSFGWVDVRHFGRAAAEASSKGSVVTEILGAGNEVVQWATEWGGDYRSGFSPEDMSSNAAGAQFGDDYLDKKGSAEAVLREWLRDAGALPDEAPSAHREQLPDTDPSARATDDTEKRWWQFWR